MELEGISILAEGLIRILAEGVIQNVGASVLQILWDLYKILVIYN